jgi:hypothetical protein
VLASAGLVLGPWATARGDDTGLQWKSSAEAFAASKAALARVDPALKCMAEQHKKNDANNESIRELSQKAQTILDEKARSLNDLRQGFFCSQCKNTQTEIEKSGKETFREHLNRVDGTPVPAEAEVIEQKARQFDSKIEGVQREVEAKKREYDKLVEAWTRCENERQQAYRDQAVAEAQAGLLQEQEKQEELRKKQEEYFEQQKERARKHAEYVQSVLEQLREQQRALLGPRQARDDSQEQEDDLIRAARRAESILREQALAEARRREQRLQDEFDAELADLEAERSSGVSGWDSAGDRAVAQQEVYERAQRDLDDASRRAVFDPEPVRTSGSSKGGDFDPYNQSHWADTRDAVGSFSGDDEYESGDDEDSLRGRASKFVDRKLDVARRRVGRAAEFIGNLLPDTGTEYEHQNDSYFGVVFNTKNEGADALEEIGDRAGSIPSPAGFVGNIVGQITGTGWRIGTTTMDDIVHDRDSSQLPYASPKDVAYYVTDKYFEPVVETATGYFARLWGTN